jgi:O-acetyl-ADP-ribose deacetylase (regulator of RNase III)
MLPFQLVQAEFEGRVGRGFLLRRCRFSLGRFRWGRAIAVWRPADVEQREGRILRQGNRNKTVQIYRYVTEASFDAYMWQTLETKAKFIHQVMSGDTHIRHIEDIDSRALTYAEVKAIASGNPLVIEKASVDAEITRLTRLRSQHAETQFRIRSELRRSKEALPVIGKRIENIKLDIAGRTDTRGDAFQIELEKQVVKDRGIAGELLNRIARRVAGSTNSHVVGLFAGFQVLARPAVLQPTEIVLKGHNYYTAHVSETALGTIRSLEHTAQNLEERLAYHQRELADTEKKCGELEAKVGQAFEHETKLQSLGQRQKELEEALDISKNQASNALAAEETELQAENETETISAESMNITYQAGDATQPNGNGAKIIVHVCNDLGGWGKGFVVALSGRWAEPERRYRAWHRGGEAQPFALGQVQFVQVDDAIWVANMIGQHGMGSRNGIPPVRYEAIRDGLRSVATKAKELDASVHMPRIGSGLAGGKWEQVERIIREELTAADVAVTVYDLSQRQTVGQIFQKH